MAKDKQAAEEPFEDIYRRLQAKVESLEQGGLSLDDAIALYEEGMLLARACQERLDAAEQKITRLKESFAPAGDLAAMNDVVEDYVYVSENDSDESVEELP